MTKRAGQVTTLQALASLAALVAMAGIVVAGSHALVPPAALTPPLDAPAGEPIVCPTALEPGGDPVRVTAGQLIECPDAFDGVTVRYEGEVVRAVLQQGTRAWVQVNDDPYALLLGPLPEHRTAVGGNSGIAVSLPLEFARTIATVGGPRSHGDVIAVVGTFLRADPDDGGGPSIRAEEAQTIQAGRGFQERPLKRLVVVAAAVVALAGALTWAVRRRRFGPRPP